MSDSENLLPVYHKSGTNLRKMLGKKEFRIPFSRFGWICISSNFFSFVFCVVWSILFNYEEANATHCSVENFLPSISAAIGHYYPQIYVWNTTIVLQMFPRLKISNMYHQYYKSVIYEKYSKWYNLVRFFNIVELWSLLGLSLITSTMNYTLHAFFFVCFLFSSIFYMILTCFLLKFKRKIPPENLEARTLKWKFECCVFNIFCFLLAGYFFRRHNLYCEPRVYSVFAMFEYGVVVSNMLFHLLAIWDFHDRVFTVAVTSRGLEVSHSPPFKSF